MELHRTIIHEGKQLHYRDEGRDKPNTLVLLHGFLQSLDVWSSYTLSYMRHMRVITIDLPGHGYSDQFANTHTTELMAKCVKAVLDDAGVDQCVMIGHSMGGYVALAFAELYPYSLRGLGLIHSHALPDDEDKKISRDAVCQQVTNNRAGFILEFVPRLFDASKRTELAQEIKDLQDQCLETKTASIIAAQQGMKCRPSRLNTLQRLQVPCLFIYGKNDHRLPLEVAVSQAMIPHYSEIMILDNVGHMAHMEERDYVKMRIKNFVDTCYA